MHSQRERTLMKTISQLQEKNQALEEEQRGDKRSRNVQKMAKDLRHQENVSSILRKTVIDMTDLGPPEVDDLILRKTVGGPSRFGERTREELVAEVNKLKRKLKKSRERVSTLKQKNAELCDALRSKLSDPKCMEDTKRRDSEDSLDSEDEDFEQDRGGESRSQGVLGNHSRMRSSGIFPSIDAHMEVDDLSATITEKDRWIHQQRNDIEKLEDRIAELRKEVWDLRTNNDDLETHMETLQKAKDDSQKELRQTQIELSKAQTDLAYYEGAMSKLRKKNMTNVASQNEQYEGERVQSSRITSAERLVDSSRNLSIGSKICGTTIRERKNVLGSAMRLDLGQSVLTEHVRGETTELARLRTADAPFLQAGTQRNLVSAPNGVQRLPLDSERNAVKDAITPHVLRSTVRRLQHVQLTIKERVHGSSSPGPEIKEELESLRRMNSSLRETLEQRTKNLQDTGDYYTKEEFQRFKALIRHYGQSVVIKIDALRKGLRSVSRSRKHVDQITEAFEHLKQKVATLKYWSSNALHTRTPESEKNTASTQTDTTPEENANSTSEPEKATASTQTDQINTAPAGNANNTPERTDSCGQNDIHHGLLNQDNTEHQLHQVLQFLRQFHGQRIKYLDYLRTIDQNLRVLERIISGNLVNRDDNAIRDILTRLYQGIERAVQFGQQCEGALSARFPRLAQMETLMDRYFHEFYRYSRQWEDIARDYHRQLESIASVYDESAKTTPQDPDFNRRQREVLLVVRDNSDLYTLPDPLKSVYYRLRSQYNESLHELVPDNARSRRNEEAADQSQSVSMISGEEHGHSRLQNGRPHTAGPNVRRIRVEEVFQ
eukprot:gb/GECG01006750.1/.p1 GENE.gb/GECG01006750.1/~~gb/GECG01006750.1/.p1  ORF type:complete len:834 (+),score=117.33 gb/GECG01006750.1/:1-2502(+)